MGATLTLNHSVSDIDSQGLASELVLRGTDDQGKNARRRAYCLDKSLLDGDRVDGRCGRCQVLNEHEAALVLGGRLLQDSQDVSEGRHLLVEQAIFHLVHVLLHGADGKETVEDRKRRICR